MLRHDQINERHSEEQTMQTPSLWLMQINAARERLFTPKGMPKKLSEKVTLEVKGHELNQINVRCKTGTQRPGGIHDPQVENVLIV